MRPSVVSSPRIKIGTRNFANLLVGVLVVDKMGRNDGQLLMISLWKVHTLDVTIIN